MKDISLDIQSLLDQYGSDTALALKENSRIEYLYALSDIRENLLEWYDFFPDAALLQIGSDYGALTGLYAEKVKEVVVLDPSEENLKTNEIRHKRCKNIRYVNGPVHKPQSVLGGKQFDYVVMVGTLTAPFDQQLHEVKKLLRPNGKLIIAAANKFGMKYWAGAKQEEYSVSESELLNLVNSGENGDYEIYYPMPDYKLPVTIYSQDFLPGKGDLANTVIAYDYPKYLKLDVGEMFDAVCEDGKFPYFSNSFLIIWSSHEEN